MNESKPNGETATAIATATPAHTQSGQQATKQTIPAVSTKLAGAKTKTRAIHHPTAAQRFPNPEALTVITMPDGTKRLRRPDKPRR